MRIFSSGTPSSSAAICASAVTMPCPSSTLPTLTDTVPSGSKRMRVLSGIKDRLDHAVVRAAAAEVLVEGFAHLGLRRARICRQQSNCVHHDAAHAIPALRSLVTLERFLQRMISAQTFDGRHTFLGDE